MQVVWAADGPVTVRAVLERLNARRDQPLAYTTVMTVMTRLAEREVLSRSPSGRTYEYVPLVSDVADLAVRDVMRDYGEAAVAHFVDQARATPQLLRRLQQQMSRTKEVGD
jgi:predicted transcriptional regulator